MEKKVKVGVTKMKDKGTTGLFSVYCNGFGPGSSEKIDQVIKEIKRRHVDETMISSSDTRWRTVDKSTIGNKLKTIASNFFKMHQIAKRL